MYWTKIVVRPYSELDFSIRETKMDHFCPFWPEEVHFGPFRSANRTLAIPDIRFLESVLILGSPLRGPELFLSLGLCAAFFCQSVAAF